MELEGSLTAFNLPEILQFLSMGKMTGLFHISRDDYSLTLHIKEGKIIDSSSLNDQKTLGEMLVDRALLKRKDLDEVLKIQKENPANPPLGKLLVDSGYMENNVVQDLLRLKLEEDIWDLFSWNKGHFKFEHAGTQRVGSSLVNINIEPLIMEGSRRVDEWKQIADNIKNDKIVFCINQKSDYKKIKYELSLNDWKILSLINGFWNVKSIINRSGLGKFETYRILNTLYAIDCIRVKDNYLIEEEHLPSRNRIQEQETPNIEKDDRKNSFLKGLFKPSKNNYVSQEMRFVSPIGLISNFINVLIFEYAKDPEAQRNLFNIWLNALASFTKADLLKFSNNKINSDKFELALTYVDDEDMFETFHICYEDAFDALRYFLNSFFETMTDSLSSRNIKKLAKTLLDETYETYELKVDRDFVLKDFVKEVVAL